MSGNNGAGSEESRIIKTKDENGQVYDFELIDIIELDGQEYGFLVYLDEDEQKKEEEEEQEVVVMKLNKDNESYVFETIDDDQEFEKIISRLEVEEEDSEEEE